MTGSHLLCLRQSVLIVNWNKPEGSIRKGEEDVRNACLMMHLFNDASSAASVRTVRLL
jgi:hypothetical protein